MISLQAGLVLFFAPEQAPSFAQNVNLRQQVNCLKNNFYVT